MAETGAPATTSAIDSLGKGTVVIVVGTLALFLLSFIGRIAVARHLSVEGFGDFNLGLALAGLLSLVALMGLHQATARTLAATHDLASRRRVIRTTAIITAIASVVVSAVVYLLADQISDLFDPAQATQLTVVFHFFSITVGLTLLCTFIASVFQGFEDTIPYAWINQAVQPAAFVIFVYILFAYHLELSAALYAWVISNVVTFIALVIYAIPRLPKHLPPGPTAAELPTGMFVLSLSLWGVSTLTFVTAYVDTLILGAFRPEEQVGIYSAVMTLARLILIAAVAVTYIFLPVTARLNREGDFDTIRSSYVTTTRWAVLFAMPIFLVFAFLPSETLHSVFGKSYIPGSLALVLVTAAALTSIAFGPVNVTLAGMGQTRPLLLATAISAGSNVVLSFTLIPTYGLIGAAIAWSVARMLYPATGALALYTTHRIGPLHRTFLYPLTAALAVGVPIFLVVALLSPPDWVIYPLWVLGVAIFALSVLFTRSVERGDFVVIRILEKILKRPLPGVERFFLRYTYAPPLTLEKST